MVEEFKCISVENKMVKELISRNLFKLTSKFRTLIEITKFMALINY